MKALLGSRLVFSCSLLCITISLCSIPLSTTQAQVQPPAKTSITSSGLNTEVSAPTALPNGKVNYDITGGTRPGGGPNLFHSFGEFSVATNHIANFLNETALPTSNIIGRITGGQVSNIWGTIQTTGFGAANLYLTNPSGFIFGPTASLNVGGSFAATTADYLRMTDGAKFYADPVPSSVLSIANVASFGFTSPRPMAIVVQGSTLAVPIGHSLSLVGGNGTFPDLDNTSVDVAAGVTMTGGTLSAPGGQINVVSVASAGEVIPSLAEPNPAFDVSSFALLGDITLASNTILDTSGDGGGTVVIRGGHLTIDRSTVRSDTRGSNDGARIGVDINIAGDISFINGGFILSNTGGPGTGGDINLNATDAIDINGGAIQSVADVGSTGKGGSITVTAKDLTLEGVGEISTTTSGSGNAGDIAIKADNATRNSSSLGDQLPFQIETFIQSETLGTGNAGSIDLSVGTLTLNQSAISSLSVVGTGSAGTITIQGITGSGSPAANVSLDSGQITTDTFGGSAANTAANIDITAHTLTLANGASITADTFGAAPAGDITLNVGTLNLVGQLSFVDPELGVISISPVISSSSLPFSIDGALTGTEGNAGTITIQGITGSGSPAASVNLESDVVIQTQTFGGRAANTPANIDITARTLTLADGAFMTADSLGAAPAGDITLNVGTLTVDGSSKISSSYSNFLDFTGGNAGSITIQGVTGAGSPATSVSLDGHSGIDTAVGGSAASTAANIDITAHTLTLANGSFIGADTVGAAPAGDITLNVGTLNVVGQVSFVVPEFGVISIESQISSSSSSSAIDSSDTGTEGNAGTITIQGITGSGSPAASVNLESGGSINTQTIRGRAANTAANIDITAHTLALTNGGGIRADTSGAAPAGDITLNVGTLMAGNSAISSSSSVTDSTAGNAGSITIQGVTGAGSPATSVSLDGLSIISTVGGSAASTAANIDITAHTLTLANGAFIGADTLGVAPAGDITLNVGTLNVVGWLNIDTGFGVFPVFSKISSDSSIITIDDSGTGTGGNAGTITIQGITGSGSSAASVTLDSGQINTNTFGGSAANTAANIDIAARTLTLANGGGIRADTVGAAPAGDITLNVGTLNVVGLFDFVIPFAIDFVKSTISSTSGFTVPGEAGNAGTITIQGITGSGSPAANVSLDSGVISTETIGGSAANTAANIDITARTLTLANGAFIGAETLGVAETLGAAPAGDITLNVDTLTAGNSAISSSSSVTDSTAGNAGTITIQGITGSGSPAANVSLHNSSITTAATQASGGNITLRATDMIRLRDSTISASVFGGPTTAGGNILLDPNFIILQNSHIIAEAIEGAGGNINLAFNQAFLADPRSTISASSQFGVSGTVNINSPTQPLSGALVPLEQSFLSGNTISNQRCAARMAQGQISTFIVTEREGLPQEPGGMLLSGLVEPDGTAASETLEPIRVASVSHPPFTLLTPEPVQLTWSHDTCRRLTSKGSER